MSDDEEPYKEYEKDFDFDKDRSEPAVTPLTVPAVTPLTVPSPNDASLSAALVAVAAATNAVNAAMKAVQHSSFASISSLGLPPKDEMDSMTLVELRAVAADLHDYDYKKGKSM